MIPNINKYVNYSISAVTAKIIAMTIEAPITLIKTRVEKIGSSNIMEEFKYILSNPSKGVLKGLGSTLAREGIYTFFHYNTFRYLKDSVF